MGTHDNECSVYSCGWDSGTQSDINGQSSEIQIQYEVQLVVVFQCCLSGLTNICNYSIHHKLFQM